MWWGWAVLLYLGVVFGATASPGVVYWLLGRGVRASSALRVGVAVSAVLLALAVAPLVLLVFGVAGLAGWVGVAGVVALFAAQYLLAPFIVLRGLRVRRPGRGEEWLVEALERLGREAGYRGRVELFIAEDDVPNAFAVSSPLRRAIVVNRGLLRVLGRDEVVAVLGHELGHIVNRDSGYMAAVSLAPGLTYLLGVALVLGGLVSIRAASAIAEAASYAGDEETAGAAAAASLGGLFIGLVMLVIGALVAGVSVLVNLAVLGFSRVREHLADAHSVRVTRSLNIVPALEKIEEAVAAARAVEERRGGLSVVPRLRNLLYIVPRLYASLYAGLRGVEAGPLEWIAPLSTHPPLEARVFVASRVYEEVVGGRVTF